MNLECVTRLQRSSRVDTSLMWSAFCLHILEAFPEIVGIVLFGSGARNELKDHSDLDLLLVLPQGALPHRELYRRWDQREALQSFQNREVSPQWVTYPKAEDAGGIWYEAALEGIVLFDAHSCLQELFEKLRRKVERGEMIAEIAYGQRYWKRG